MAIPFTVSASLLLLVSVAIATQPSDADITFPRPERRTMFVTPVKRVTLRFTDECAASVAAVESLDTHLAPHGWHALPPGLWNTLPPATTGSRGAAVLPSAADAAAVGHGGYLARRPLPLGHATAKYFPPRSESSTAPAGSHRFKRVAAFELVEPAANALQAGAVAVTTYVDSFDDPRRLKVHMLEGDHDPVAAAHLPVTVGIDDIDGEALAATGKVVRKEHASAHAKKGHHGHHHGDHNGHDHKKPDGVAREATATQAEGFEALWVPRDVAALRLYCGNTSAFVRIALPAHLPSGRSFRAQTGTATAAGDVEMRTIQHAGPPLSQYNIIFLAGGFTAAQKDMFFHNASNISNLMLDKSMDSRLEQEPESNYNLHRSVPFNRYWSFFNVYAVFQPSDRAGADRPLVGLTVNNNLQCQHPAEMERAVFCDRDLAVALASVTPGNVRGDPDRNIIVAIVNTAIYGGSAIDIPGRLHMGNFFNGFNLNNPDERTRMLSLVDHELGHAFGNLMDEYSVGVPEPADRDLGNCQIGRNGGPPTGSALRWRHWLDIKRANMTGWKQEWDNGLRGTAATQWDVLDTPEAVCGFTNYFKPNANCAMNRLRDYFMCPVCREASTVKMFNNTFALDWPRWPLKDVTTVVPTTNVSGYVSALGQMVLHLPPQLKLSNGFNVTFVDVDGAIIPQLGTDACPVCAVIGPANFAKYPLNTEVRIRVLIEDNAGHFVTPTMKPRVTAQMNQASYFKILVTNDVTNFTANSGKNVSSVRGERNNAVGEHALDTQSTYTYCEGEPGGNPNATLCNMTFQNREYERPLDVGGLLASVDEWVLIGLGGLALVFVLLWVWAANAYSSKAGNRVRPIFETEFSCCIKIVRWIMLGSAVCFLIASVGVIGVSAYYYFKASTVGRIIIAMGIALAILLYLMAFIGYWAVASRSKKMLIVNFFVLLLGMGCLIFVFVVVASIGGEMKKKARWNVGDSFDIGIPDPNAITGQNTTEKVNEYWTGQLEVLWIKIVADNPELACAVQGILKCSGFYTSCASAIGSSATCPRNCQKTNEKYQTPCRAVFRNFIVDNYSIITMIVGGCVGLLFFGIVFNFVYFCGLWSAKRAILEGNKKKIESVARKSGATKQQVDRFKALYLLKSLDASSTQRLAREFKRIDSDGNGELDRKELFLFFKKAMHHTASQAELDEIFRQVDADNSGTISIPEFLGMFGNTGGLSPEEFLAAVQGPTKRDLLGRKVAANKGAAAPMKRVDAEELARRRRQLEAESGVFHGSPTSTGGAAAALIAQQEHRQGTLHVPEAAPARSRRAEFPEDLL